MTTISNTDNVSAWAFVEACTDEQLQNTINFWTTKKNKDDTQKQFLIHCIGIMDARKLAKGPTWKQTQAPAPMAPTANDEPR